MFTPEQRDLLQRKVPARHVGEHVWRIRKMDGHRHRHADGKQLKSLDLSRGQTLMMYPAEVYGQTYLHDPRGEKPSRWLGLGRVVLPDHQELSEEELGVVGYEFHLPRPDVEPVTPLDVLYPPSPQPVETSANAKTKDGKKDEKKEGGE